MSEELLKSGWEDFSNDAGGCFGQYIGPHTLMIVEQRDSGKWRRIQPAGLAGEDFDTPEAAAKAAEDALFVQVRELAKWCRDYQRSPGSR